MDNKPSELAVRIASAIRARMHVSDPLGKLIPIIAEHIAPLEGRISLEERSVFLQTWHAERIRYQTELETALAESKAECERLRTDAPTDTEVQWLLKLRKEGIDRLIETESERDSLTADNAALRQQVEGLRKDAERYRWLKARMNEDAAFCDNSVPFWHWGMDWKEGETAEAAIDAAMSSVA